MLIAHYMESCLAAFLPSSWPRSRPSLNFLRSQIARSIAIWVFACIVLIEIIILIPSTMRFERERLDELITAERGKLAAAVDAAQSGPETLSLERLQRLLAIRVYSLGGTLLYSRGDLPEIALDSSPAKPLLRYANGTADVLWQFESQGAKTLVYARLDASHVAPATRAYILRIIGLVVLISAVVTLGTMLVTHRLVLMPLRRVISALRANRAEQRREPLRWQRRDELGQLIAEYNRLIEAQRNSERRVTLKQKHLEYMAHHDSLTNLPNRTAFTETLQRHCVSGQCDRGLLLVMANLDHFKRLNDLHGRRAGDAVLAEAGRRMQVFAQNHGAGHGMAARLEGDELILMLACEQRRLAVGDSGQATACSALVEQLAHRLRSAVEEPYYVDGMRFEPRVSLGLAFGPEHGRDAEDLLAHVRMALDEAKRRGRGRHWLFDDEVRERTLRRTRMEEDIKRALVEEQFSVHYQPKVDIRTRRVTGVEALVRWEHPQRGAVPPDAFIPLAEECGLVVPLGEWVLQRACRDACHWLRAGCDNITVAVNISAMQMQSHQLFDTIAAALAQSGLPPHLLELEITESAVMEEPEEVIALLDRLRGLGLQLAVDDFGTGYSSLTYLKRFPVHTLKIDKTFIDDVTRDRDDAAIVASILELGRHFGLKVVAEGVEDASQLTFLAERGCDIAQGYHFSRALPSAALLDWVIARGDGPGDSAHSLA